MREFKVTGLAISIQLVFACGHQTVSAAPSSKLPFSAPPAACSSTTKLGETCESRPDQIRPTQFAIGMRDVESKREKIAKIKNNPERLAKYLSENILPAVKGPDGIFYLTDGHHRTRALLDEGVKRVYVRISKDKARLRQAEFWIQMRDERLVWLFDENGTGPLRPEDLPANLKGLRDDLYRSLSEETLDDECYSKTDTPFQQFMWANYYRPKISAEQLRRDWPESVKLACKLSHLPAAKDLPGYIPER
jgi:hypothetical protein